jgi:hypothetical protein
VNEPTFAHDPPAIFDAFERHRVEHVTIGGLAVAFWGYARATDDTDVVVPSGDPENDARLQAAADKALRAGLIAYDRARGGWRGPVGHIDPGAGWPLRLAAAPLPAGAASVGWQLAMVLRSDGDGAAIGLSDGETGRIPFSQMRWARPLRDDSTLGP